MVLLYLLDQKGRKMEDWEAILWSAIVHPFPVPKLSQGAWMPNYVAYYLDSLLKCPSTHLNILVMF